MSVEGNSSIFNISCEWFDVSQQNPVYSLYSYIVNGLLLAIVIAFGLMGNVLTIYILSLKELQAKINLYFIVMACWDNVLLLTSLILYAKAALQYGELPSLGPHVYVYLVLYPISNIATTASVWVLLATAIERYFAISQPFKHKCTYTQFRIRLILATTSSIAVAFNVIKFLEISIQWCLSVDGELIPAVAPSPLRYNPVYFIIYHILMHLFLVYFGPFTVQAILTALISYHLQKSHQYRRQSVYRRSKKRDSLEATMTKMFVIVCLKFLLCFTLPTVLNICEVVISAGQFFRDNALSYAVDLSNFLVVCNSAFNFPIYMVFCPRFRRELLSRISCRRFGKVEADNPTEHDCLMQQTQNGRNLCVYKTAGPRLSNCSVVSFALPEAEDKLEEDHSTSR